MSGYLLTPRSDGFVDVEVLTAAAADAVRAALLDAADNPRQVRTTTHHARPGFLVSRDLADAAGLFTTPDEEPVKPPAKKAAPRKAAPKAVGSAEVRA